MDFKTREIYILQRIYIQDSQVHHMIFTQYLFTQYFIIFLLGAYKFVLDNINFFI